MYRTVELAEQCRRSRTMLLLFMASCRAEAIDDLRWGTGSPAGLYDRFPGWVRPARVPKSTVAGDRLISG